MNAIWEVMTFEYARHVFRKRFLFALLSLPAFILVMAFVVFLLVRSEFNTSPVGYVDHSGLLTGPGAVENEDSWVALKRFSTEEEAEEALNLEEIQAYYVLSPDFLETRQTKLVALEEPSGVATSQFTQLVRANLLAQFPPEIIQRLSQGNQLVVQSLDGSRQFVQGDWLGFVLPFMVGFIFLVAVFATSGYLLQAVVEEKENRTMELLVTTISPNKLMAGKIIGIIAVGWTQLLAWFGMVMVLVLFGSLFFDLPEWISFSTSYLVLALVLFVPAFIMLAALMVAVGADINRCPGSAAGYQPVYTAAVYPILVRVDPDQLSQRPNCCRIELLPIHSSDYPGNPVRICTDSNLAAAAQSIPADPVRAGCAMVRRAGFPPRDAALWTAGSLARFFGC